MKNVKIIFFDIDGTLIDMTRKAISDKTVETLLRLKERGVKICIATGRAPGSVPKFDGVDFDAFLTFNGSYCYNSNDSILSTPIPKVDVERMIENAARINRPVSIASKDRVVANGADEDLIQYFGFSKQAVPVSDDFEMIENAARINRPVSIASKDRVVANGADEDLIQYFGFSKQAVPVSDDFDDVLNGEIYQIMMGGRKEEYDDILKADEDLIQYFGFSKQAVPVSDDFDDVLNGEIYQIMMGGRKEEYDDILKCVENAKITAWWDRAVDIIPANSGKGKGIEAILEYYGIDRFESMAFGDGGNDIEMLQTVGTGVAMGNALDNVKEVADEVCGTSADDGIYHYCLENGLI